MRLTIVWCLSTMLCIFASAQEAVDIHYATDQNYYFFTPQVEVLESDSLLSINDITGNGSSSSFKKKMKNAVSFVGFNDRHYWFRFVLFNSQKTPADRYIVLAPVIVQEAHLFKNNDTGFIAYSPQGSTYGFHNRAMPFTHVGFPVSIAGGASDTFYLSTEQRHINKMHGFILFTPKTLVNKIQQLQLVVGIISGILLLFITLNIFLYISIKEKIHLWYSLYLFLLLAFVWKFEALDQQYIYPSLPKGYQFISMTALGTFASAAFLKVIKLFLIKIKPGSLLSRLLTFATWFAFLISVLLTIVLWIEPKNIIVEQLIFAALKVFYFLLITLVYWSIIYSVQKGQKAALFFLSGLLLFTLGGVFMLGSGQGELVFAIPNPFEIGMMIEVLIISFGLMYQYNFLKKERQRIADELQQEKITKASQLIRAQEEERKRIARDLHDELGSNLALAQLQIHGLKTGSNQPEDVILLLKNTSKQLRNISHNLMPPEFESLALPKVIEDLTFRLSRDGNTRFTLEIVQQQQMLPKDKEIIVYRIISELLYNVTKHAKATHCGVSMDFAESFLKIVVQDNGIGMSSDVTDGIGLKNIESRLQYLNAEQEITSSDKGTRFTLIIPY